MRIHIADGFAHIAVEKVTVDGFTQKHCVMADTELGCIERYKTNSCGELVHINGNLCKEERVGRVEIIFKNGWSMNHSGNYVHSFGNEQQVFQRKKL